MASTLQAKRITDALEKAKRVGRIEQRVTIDDCSIYLQNLSPQDYQDIFQELEDVPENEYVYRYQLANLTRSVVEFNGVDLRGVQFVEEDVPTGAHIITGQTLSLDVAKQAIAKLKELNIAATLLPPEEGTTKPIKKELHRWIGEALFPTWGKEAISVAFRKFADVLEEAEELSKKGVEFKTPDETSEEKLRRVLNDLQEPMDNLPDELIDRVLAEAGFMRTTTANEMRGVEERLSEVAEATPPVEPEAEPVPVQPTSPQPPVPAQAQVPAPDLQELMAGRQPLNQQYTDAPVQVPPIQTVSGQTRVGVPAQIRNAAVPVSALSSTYLVCRLITWHHNPCPSHLRM